MRPMTTPDLLAAIVASAKKTAHERVRQRDSEVERAAASRRPRAAAFVESLKQPGVRVIAECKRRSPSRGVLRAFYDPVAIARSFASAGAAAISVLTEPAFFDGSIDHLRAVREAVDVPLLRKDFLVTEFQLIEARAAGADAVLLIVAALDDPALAQLIAQAGRLGLAALVEAHDELDLERALAAGATVVGVNSRNLRTLEVSTAVFEDLVARLPADVIAVAESGLQVPSDLVRLSRCGYRAFLIGERFMIDPDPGTSLATFIARASAEAVRQ
jgi:indole-3-glycerol phosphate synthase